jgi:hypothetical protein
VNYEHYFLQCELGESAGVRSPTTTMSTSDEATEAQANLLLQAAKSPKLAKKVIQVVNQNQAFIFPNVIRPEVRISLSLKNIKNKSAVFSLNTVTYFVGMIKF